MAYAIQKTPEATPAEAFSLNVPPDFTDEIQRICSTFSL